MLITHSCCNHSNSSQVERERKFVPIFLPRHMYARTHTKTHLPKRAPAQRAERLWKVRKIKLEYVKNAEKLKVLNGNLSEVFNSSHVTMWVWFFPGLCRCHCQLLIAVLSCARSPTHTGTWWHIHMIKSNNLAPTLGHSSGFSLVSFCALTRSFAKNSSTQQQCVRRAA